MDVMDKMASKMEGDAEFKHPVNALVSFSETATGKRLGTLAAHFALSRTEKSSITFLQLLKPRDSLDQAILTTSDKTQHAGKLTREINPGEIQAAEPETMESDVYKNKVLTNLIEKGEKNPITIRTFVKKSEDWVSDILNTAKEQESDLVLMGINFQELNPSLWQKYYRLKSNPAHSDKYIFSQFHANEARALNNSIALIDRNPVASGLFMNLGLEKVRRIFVPLLSVSDVQVFPYILFRFAEKENIELMIWDAIGIIQTDQRVQKLYHMIVKKTDGRVLTWNDDLKIERDFIQRQDLVIMGIDGWAKLLITGLPWINALPSTLIIKDNIL